MKVFKNIDSTNWNDLTERPVIETQTINKTVQAILNNVKQNGDKAIFDYAKQFDKVDLQELFVLPSEIEKAKAQVNPKLKEAIKLAKQNIEKFHNSQFQSQQVVETSNGVQCWRKSVAIEESRAVYPRRYSTAIFNCFEVRYTCNAGRM